LITRSLGLGEIGGAKGDRQPLKRGGESIDQGRRALESLCISYDDLVGEPEVELAEAVSGAHLPLSAP
jgi:hypothetical protein